METHKYKPFGRITIIANTYLPGKLKARFWSVWAQAFGL
jgi:hypothetical protein